MDINTPAAQLCAQVPEREKFIRAHENMNGLRAIGQRFDDIQLIRKPPPGAHLRQVLRLIDKHGCGPPKCERPLDSVLVLRSDGSLAWRKSHDPISDPNSRRGVDLV